MKSNTEIKNKTDVNNYNRFLESYDGDLKTMNKLLEVVEQKRLHVEPMIYALDHARLRNGNYYQNDWFPNYLNSLQRVIRKREQDYYQGVWKFFER